MTVDMSRMPHLTQSQKPWRGLILWLEISLDDPTPNYHVMIFSRHDNFKSHAYPTQVAPFNTPSVFRYGRHMPRVPQPSS